MFCPDSASAAWASDDARGLLTGSQNQNIFHTKQRILHRLITRMESFTGASQSTHNRAERFPHKLHRFLEGASNDPKISDIVSWTSDGKGFVVHDKNLFNDIILPVYFEGMKSYKSFRRQLNLYGITKRFDYPGRSEVAIGKTQTA